VRSDIETGVELPVAIINTKWWPFFKYQVGGIWFGNFVCLHYFWCFWNFKPRIESEPEQQIW